MANLGIFEINTNGEFVDLSTITSLTFTEGTKYTMQAINGGSMLTVCIATSAPTEKEGFVIKDLEKFSCTLGAGENIYVYTGGLGNVKLNIAE